MLLKKPILDAEEDFFNETLVIEGKDIASYWDESIKHRVVFRNVRDLNQANNASLTLYRRNDTNIHQGDLLKLEDRIYLVINHDNEGIAPYRIHDLLRCNAMINLVAGSREIILPIYAYDLLNTNAISGEQISVVGGFLEFLSEDCPDSRVMVPNVQFTSDQIGGTFKIVNSYFLDGISHIFVTKEVNAQPTVPVYALTNDLPANLSVGTETPLQATAKIDGVTIENATLVWTVSDESIATINNGVITAHQPGQITVTVRWVQHSIGEAVDVVVEEEAVGESTISGGDNIVYGLSGQYVGAFYLNGQSQTQGVTFTWSLTLDSTLVGKVTLSGAGTNVTINVADNESLVGKTFGLVLSADYNGSSYTATKSIFIRGWF